MNYLSTSRAFEREQGQFVCHLQAIVPDDNRFWMTKTIETVLLLQTPKFEHLSTWSHWAPIYDDDQKLHVSLIRGHKAVAGHHIQPLYEEIKEFCDYVNPMPLFMSQFSILTNHEGTKEFLTVSERVSKFVKSPTLELALSLDPIIKKYAINLNDENFENDDDTLIHCSLMQRNAVDWKDPFEKRREELMLDKLLDKYSGIYCRNDVFFIKNLNFIAGCYTYPIELKEV